MKLKDFLNSFSSGSYEVILLDSLGRYEDILPCGFGIRPDIQEESETIISQHLNNTVKEIEHHCDGELSVLVYKYR